METSKLSRMNLLFEKVMASNANLKEQAELKALYKEFIDDGRSVIDPSAVHQYYAERTESHGIFSLLG
ncbi:hypothetical protein ACFSJY_13170 [Thalassotalea euphylliae]|uniref:hypothetical protein n=1 Tax=Thalassotalea euphylliae TaxID=1655234 RepID=UPI0036433369